MQGQDHYLSYNGDSAVADGTLHTAAAPDQMREEPVASGVPESKQAQQPHAEDSQTIPKDQARHPQDEAATGRENLNQEATSNPADTSAATPEGVAPEEEEAEDGDDDDWGDDFGGFEEAAERAEEHPSTQTAEPVAAHPAPEAPSEDADASEMAQLFSASHEGLLQLVSRHLLGPGHLTNGQLHNVSSTTVDDSLQSLANKLQSLTPEASELTQKALQIGNKHKGAPNVEPIAWAGSDTEAAFLSSLPLRKRASEQGDTGDSAASEGPARKAKNATNVSSMHEKHGDKQATDSGSALAQIRVGMESSQDKAVGGENAALRALIQKLPDLSYMLSDSLVRPPRMR
ncbi:g990 [Coccomyxa viridis]|uniref:G990 protein n=1 Tax=Coccomyxa viridis TaxID=1274662 RepID=A0ABP1FGZ7_9CHLO